MQAITFDKYGASDVLTLVERPVPQPGPGEVRVEMRAAAVLPVDCKIRRGDLQNFFDIAFPKVPGRDGAGIVTAIGPGVDFAKVGDRVCVVAGHLEQGTYQQVLLRDLETVAPIPSELGFAEAAALIHSGICSIVTLLDTAQIQPGMKLLVHGGAGAIGAMAIQLAKSEGLYVATTCRHANLDYVTAMGADLPIAYDRQDFTELVRDYDVVLDLVGGDIHRRSYLSLREGGHLVCLRAQPIEDLSGQYAVRLSIPRIAESRALLERTMTLASRGVFRPQIAARMTLSAARDAHRAMDMGRVSGGRIVLDIPPLSPAS